MNKARESLAAAHHAARFGVSRPTARRVLELAQAA